jgi:hypothetical protein
VNVLAQVFAECRGELEPDGLALNVAYLGRKP